MAVTAARIGGIAAAAVLIVATTASGAPARARLQFDFASATLEVVTADGARRFALAPELGPRLTAFREAVARGEWSRETAAALGDDLLGPAADVLRDVDRWEVTPLEAAPLGALVAPWDPTHPLVDAVALSYRPEGIDPHDAEPAGPAPPPEAGQGVLAVAPFTSADLQADTVDTLLAAWRAGSRTVDLVPRNDVDDAAVARALGDQRYVLTWLRAAPEQLSALLAALSTGPHLLWWSWPVIGTAPTASDDDAFALAGQWAAGGKSMVLDLWPRRESVAAEGIRTWAEATTRGEDLATALATAKRALAASPQASVRDWAGWILVGDGRRSLTWHRPAWWQRWLRR